MVEYRAAGARGGQAAKAVIAGAQDAQARLAAKLGRAVRVLGMRRLPWSLLDAIATARQAANARAPDAGRSDPGDLIEALAEQFDRYAERLRAAKETRKAGKRAARSAGDASATLGDALEAEDAQTPRRCSAILTRSKAMPES
jgi:hypothetical protein